MGYMRLNISAKFLQLDHLSKHIFAIKHISETCSHARLMYMKGVTPEYMLTYLVDNKILKFIFEKSKHSELIKRAPDIMRLLIDESCLTPDDIDCLFKAAERDQTTRREIYKIFCDLGSMLKSVHSIQIFKHLQNCDISEVIE